MPELQLDTDGRCTLLFDDAHEIGFTLHQEDCAILLHCELGKASDLTAKEALLHLLSASLLGARTGGAAFGIQEELDAVVLWKRFCFDFPEASALEKAVNDFLAQVIFWKNELKGLEQKQPRHMEETFPPYGLFV